METLTNEQGLESVSGFNVYDTVLIMHLIEKLLRGGAVTGKELSYVAALRTKAIAAAQMAVGFDLERLNGPQPTPAKEEPATRVAQGG